MKVSFEFLDNGKYVVKYKRWLKYNLHVLCFTYPSIENEINLLQMLNMLLPERLSLSFIRFHLIFTQ